MVQHFEQKVPHRDRPLSKTAIRQVWPGKEEVLARRSLDFGILLVRKRLVVFSTTES